MGGYNDLLNDIPAFMDNPGSEIVAAIPTFIRLMEMQFYRDIDNQALEFTTTGTFATGNPFFPLPTQLLMSPRYLRVTDPDTGEWTMCELKEAEFLMELQSNNPASEGLPQYYGIFDNTGYQIESPPNKNYTYQFGYKQRLPALSPTNQDNWTTLQAYDAALAGCLLAAAAFVLDDRQMSITGIWQPRYDKHIKSINEIAKTAERDDFRTPDFVRSDSRPGVGGAS
jgi:hypothetical protein